MAQSKIEWTDRTWNPVTGCTKVSQGCKNCYAETMADRFWGDRKFTDVRCHPERLDQPLHWRKPSMVFVNSMSDLFHEDVPFSFIDDCHTVMECAHWHNFQILTKRPQRVQAWLDDRKQYTTYGFLPNEWVGVSVEDRDTLWRIDWLRKFPASVRFVSFEPLLEDVGQVDLMGINWVIVGGESGPGARFFHSDWARSIHDQAREYGAAFFMKQRGSFGSRTKRDKLIDFPWDLRIREFPDCNIEAIKGGRNE